MRHEAAVREFFRPEFFNRLDGVVTFDALTRAAILQITEKELQEIAGREGLRKLGLRLQWKKDVWNISPRLASILAMVRARYSEHWRHKSLRRFRDF